MSKSFTVIAARWKALMPILAYGISQALASADPDLHTPSGIKAFLSAVVVAIMVHYVPNRQTDVKVAVDPAKPADVGLAFIEVAVIIVALAVVLIAIKVY